MRNFEAELRQAEQEYFAYNGPMPSKEWREIVQRVQKLSKTVSRRRIRAEQKNGK